MGRLERFNDEVGATGRFGEFWIVLGGLILLYGIARIVASLLGMPLWPHTGQEPVVEVIQTSVLFMLLGGGFVIFGITALRAGWGRSHPEEGF